MFFILNHENNLIAADELFLETIGAKNILDASLLLYSYSIEIDTSFKSVTTDNITAKFTTTPVDSIMGKINLCQLKEVTQITNKEKTRHDDSSPDAKNEDISDEYGADDDVLEFIQSDVESHEVNIPLKNIEDDSKVLLEIDDDDILSLIEPVESTNEEDLSLDTKNEDISDEHGADDDVLEFIQSDVESHEVNIPLKNIEDDILSLIEPVESTDDKDLLSLDDKEEDFDLCPQQKSIESCSNENSSDDDILSLLEPTNISDTPEKLSFHEENEENIEKTEIGLQKTEITESNLILDIKTNHQDIEPLNDVLDTRKLSQIIGISEEEYKNFLDEFVQESKRLENELRGGDLKNSKEAIQTLKEASLLLHLPYITEKLSSLDNATSSEKNSIINSYMKLTSELIHTPILKNIHTDSQEEKEGDADRKSEIEISNDIKTEKNYSTLTLSDPSEILKSSEKSNTSSEDSTELEIELDDVKTISFYFNLKDASEQLALPESLVKEFVVDFIKQARENISVLQNAYKNKDLEKIQTTAHMLKGASSNLRIQLIADTLYDLQMNTDLNHIPNLLKSFVGQLKSLEQQMQP